MYSITKILHNSVASLVPNVNPEAPTMHLLSVISSEQLWLRSTAIIYMFNKQQASRITYNYLQCIAFIRPCAITVPDAQRHTALTP